MSWVNSGFKGAPLSWKFLLVVILFLLLLAILDDRANVFELEAYPAEPEQNAEAPGRDVEELVKLLLPEWWDATKYVPPEAWSIVSWECNSRASRNGTWLLVVVAKHNNKRRPWEKSINFDSRLQALVACDNWMTTVEQERLKLNVNAYLASKEKRNARQD